MSVTLLEVMAAAQARRAPLVAELAGYLVLGAADQSAGAPRRMHAADIVLAEDGGVRVVGAGQACAAEAAEESLRGLLRGLMQVASSATPALFRSMQRASGEGVDALIRELETALIPVNRSAARRALARLHRETTRALESGRVDISAFQLEPETSAPASSDARPAAPAVMRAPEPEPALAPEPAPEPEPNEWSVPIDVLESSPAAPEAEVASHDEPQQDETAPETILARARGERVEAPALEVDVVVELSPPPGAATEVRRSVPETPVLGTMCNPQTSLTPVDIIETDVTERVPPVFEPEATPGPGSEAKASAVPEVVPRASAEPAPGLDAEFEDEEIEWIEVEPSVEQPPARVGEPFGVAPSADPPGVAPRWKPSVVVLGGSPIVDTHPGPAAAEPEPEPTPPPRIPDEKPVPAPPRFAPRESNVSELLAGFAVAETRTDRQLRGDLKRMAGLEPTPPPATVDAEEPLEAAVGAADAVGCEAR